MKPISKKTYYLLTASGHVLFVWNIDVEGFLPGLDSVLF